MANGFPLAAIVGREDIMRLLETVFFSFTFGGDAASLAACKATIDEMRRNDVIAIWPRGQTLKDGCDEIIRIRRAAKSRILHWLPAVDDLLAQRQTGPTLHASAISVSARSPPSGDPDARCGLDQLRP